MRKRANRSRIDLAGIPNAPEGWLHLFPASSGASRLHRNDFARYAIYATVTGSPHVCDLMEAAKIFCGNTKVCGACRQANEATAHLWL